MVLFPNAKINLGLRIVERRKDGFHNIETLFLPFGLTDILEFIEIDGNDPAIEISGIKVEGNAGDNLVIGAWRIMHSRFSIPAVRVHLHKIIPIGAGLGGGSADAAFMLKGLNDYFSCGCSEIDLENFASELGSDCAFFIRNKPSIGTGRGETLEAIQIPLSGYEIVLINPGIHIGTREAYSGVKPAKPVNLLKDLLNQPITLWQKSISNDFEKSVFERYPLISGLKQMLIDQGAIYASMSGSGSSVYGIFKTGESEKISISENFFIYKGNLSCN
jgi:4-diphosphocytidyl-2-C-methyl-D-erythritol kinase